MTQGCESGHFRVPERKIFAIENIELLQDVWQRTVALESGESRADCGAEDGDPRPREPV